MKKINLQSPFLPVFGSLLSGVLMALSFPGFGYSSLAYFGLVPLMLAVQTGSKKKVALLGLLSGFVFFLISMFWLHNLTSRVEGIGLKLSALLGYTVLSIYCALYFIPPVLTLLLCVQRWGLKSWRKNIRIMFSVTMVWVASEYLRGFLFTGFPWNPLGVSQYTSAALIQISAWGGVYAVSAGIVWMNTALFVTLHQYIQGLRAKKYRAHVELMFGLLPIALSAAYGLNVILNQAPIYDTVRVALIQPNIAQSEKWDKAKDQQIRTQLRELTETASRLSDLDLIIWPETAVPDFVRVNRVSHTLVQQMVAQGTPLLVGSMDVEFSGTERTYSNSSLLFGTNGTIIAKYDKQHLVPFGEYVPFPKLMGKFTPVDVNFRAGTQSTLLPLKDSASFSVLICFEDIVAPLAINATRAGARWLVNQSNDAWFDPSSQSEQHLAHAVFRCIENRIPMARCCNTGVSATIDAYGKVTRKLAPRTSGFTTGIIHPRPVGLQKTFYTRHGNAFAKFALLASVIVLFALLFRRKKRTHK